MASTRTTWRGVTVDERTAAQLAAAARDVGPDIYVTPTQGSYRPGSRYSADTHRGAGAVDLSVAGLTHAQELRLIAALDAVGMVAWVRPAITGLWQRHIHALSIPRQWRAPHPSMWLERDELHPSAWRQITAALDGRDGMALNGPDPHAAMRTWRTWEQYTAGAPLADTPTGPTAGTGTTTTAKDLSMADISTLLARLDAQDRELAAIKAIVTENQTRMGWQTKTATLAEQIDHVRAIAAENQTRIGVGKDQPSIAARLEQIAAER